VLCHLAGKASAATARPARTTQDLQRPSKDRVTGESNKIIGVQSEIVLEPL
jgi:hypothetical protein